MLEVPIPWHCQVRSLHGLINRVKHRLTVPEENMKIRELEYSFPNCLCHVRMKEIRFNMGWDDMTRAQGSGKSSWLSLGKSQGYIACWWPISNHMLETESLGTALFICLENKDLWKEGDLTVWRSCSHWLKGFLSCKVLSDLPDGENQRVANYTQSLESPNNCLDEVAHQKTLEKLKWMHPWGHAMYLNFQHPPVTA